MNQLQPPHIIEDTSEASQFRGYLLAAGAAVLWGISGVVTKFMLNRQLEPEELLIFRTLLASMILFAWTGITAPEHLKVKPRDIKYFAILGAIGLVANQGFYYIALSMSGVGYTLMLQYLAPVFLMVYGVVSKTERMTTGKVIAAVFALSGSVAMVLGSKGGIERISFPGTLFAIGSAIGFAFYVGYGKYGLKKYDPRTMLAYAFLFAGLFWITIRPVWTLQWKSYDILTWGLFVYLATIATVIPFALFLASLKYLEPSRSSLTSTLEPVVAALIAWMWLGEHMSIVQIIGGAAVLGCVVMLQMERLFIHEGTRSSTKKRKNSW